MPVSNGVGYGPQTPTKVEHLRKIFEMHIGIAKRALSNNDYFERSYHYVDATAGPGRCPELDLDGSPLIFLDVAQQNRLSFVCDFVELRSCNCDSLRSLLPFNNANALIHQGDYSEVLPAIINRSKDRLGLLFVDPSGSCPDFETLAMIAQRRPRMELLFYVSASTLKRQHHITDKLLSDYIEMLGRKHWLVREPASNDRHQFTFLLGSNSWVFNKDYKKIRLFRLDSPEAAVFFPRLNLTRYKLKKKKGDVMARPVSFKLVSSGEKPPESLLFSVGGKWSNWYAELGKNSMNEWYKYEFASGRDSRLAMSAAKNMSQRPKYQENGEFCFTIRREGTDEEQPSYLFIMKHERGESPIS